MPFQPSQRAVDFMRCVLPEQRKYFRVHLPIRAIAIFRGLSEPQNAFLRDVNMLGAFFYCRHKPRIGQIAKLEFDIPGPTDQIKAMCEGLVVRVEEPGPEAAVGVAVEFASYSLSQPSEAKQSVQPGKPFIGWTVDMVERLFEKLSHIADSDPKCEQAA